MPTTTRSRRSHARVPSAPDDPTTAYATAAVAGEVVTGRLVRLACARHLRDLETGAARGLTWSADHAQHVLDFFPRFLRLAEGEHAGHPFTLQPWQQFIVGSLFGWLGPDGFRRFRVGFIEAAKSNGKTPLLAGVGLYGLTFDAEPGAEIYAAAVTRDQARILFTDAVKMVQASTALASLIDVNVNNLSVLETQSFFRPVSSEGRGLDGKRVHMALIDEIHEHLDAMVVDKMRAGTKGRRQGMIVEITNSGANRHSVCWQHHEFSAKVLEGIVENDAWFAYVCGLDPCASCREAGKDQPNEGCPDCDDWRDEAVWPKVVPNLGISVTAKYLREQVTEAVGMPSKQNLVKRLNFCIWTQSVERWFSAEAWDACGGAVDAEALRGRSCVGGLDMSVSSDLTAFVLVFRDADDSCDVLPFFWVPEEMILERARRDRVPYDLWAQQGFLVPTAGNVVDRKAVRETIVALAQQYRIAEICYDPAYASEISQALQDDEGFTLVAVKPTFAELNEPTEKTEELVKTRRLRHGGHPVLRWCMHNVALARDGGGRHMPSKGRSTERIDGASALVTAMKRAYLAVAPSAAPQVFAL